jgi:hypothetical protein
VIKPSYKKESPFLIVIQALTTARSRARLFSTAYQARLYKVALEEAQRHDYVRGVFLWKWFSAEGSSDPLRGDPFGIQNRPDVVAAIKGGFGG